MNKNIWLFLGVLAAVVIAGFFLLRKPPTAKNSSTMPVPSATNTTPVREIEVSGNEYSFSPASITVQKGEKVRIIFTNKGALPHNLVIDELGISTKTVVSGQSDSIEFVAESGVSLNFYCSIGNHKNLGMQGEIKVE